MGSTGSRGIVAFDLDGTLVPRTSICIHLSSWVGHHELPELEQRYDSGEIGNRGLAELDAIYYAGRTREQVWQQLADLPLIAGVPQTVRWLNAHRLIPVIATVTWSFAAAFLAEQHGFARVAGCEMAEDQGTLLGSVSHHFSAEDKVRFVETLAQEQDISLARVVAVGDSRSDIPLFEAAGLAIALNASPQARAAAQVQIETENLRDLIRPIDEYFHRLGNQLH